METVTETSPLLVIVGETASGKSALALELARKFNGEIIAGDARTIYRGMDIGTAKPTAQERHHIPHHLIDELNPDEPITAAMFKAKAEQAIAEIHQRGKLPILVGGSGLYVDSLLFDYAFNSPADTQVRKELQALDVDELQTLLRSRDIPLPENSQNPRHLIRAIETAGTLGTKSALRSNTLIIGTSVDREALRQNIAARADGMLAAGLESEVRSLVKTYDWSDILLQTIGYKEFKNYLDGHETLEQVRAAIIRNTMAYAKRQKTWFRRNEAIVYPSNQEQAVDTVTTWLNK